MHELRALVDGYGVAVDDGDVESFCSLFTDDAVLSVLDADGAERSRYEGAAELATLPPKLARYDRTLHLVSTHHARVDGDRARGTAYCEAHHRSGDVDRILYIRYEDDYVRTAAGWRIAARTVRTLWTEQR